MPKGLASPNDSLQQSTREPSTRIGDSSLDASSHSMAQRFLCSASSMGGGSYKNYLMEHLARMHTDIESTTRKLELEQRRLYHLDKMLDVAESEWNTKRAKYKMQQSSVDSSIGQKAEFVRTQERNLVKAIAELNKGNCENELLQERIDQLRKERTILDSVFKTMVAEINSNKKHMEKTVEEISEGKKTSDEAKQKTRALNKMLDRDRRGFKEEIKKMQKDLKTENEVQKEQDTLLRLSGLKEKNGRRTYMVADEEEAFSEPAMHRRILKLSFLNTIQRRHIKQHQKNIEVFEQAFATIKSSTGISDIEEIVKIFIALEQRNFSLLTFVNEVNRDIENIEIRNRELQDQLKNHRQEQTTSKVRKDEALNELSDQIKKMQADTLEKDKMIEESVSALAECRPLVWNIVNYLKKELPALIKAGYEGDPPTTKIATPEDHEEDLNNYLMYIEDAILQFRVSLSQDVQQMANLRPQPPRAPPQRPQKPSELPSAHITGDDSDDDPDTGLGDRPWTRTELRDRAQAMIQRRKRKQYGGKLIGEDKRAETVEEGPVSVTSTSTKDKEVFHGTMSVAPSSKEADTSGPPVCKSPSVASAVEGVRADDDGNRGERPENWWRGQGKEKPR